MNPWPKDHKGHWWSGWPGAWCMRCGAGDPIEEFLADGKYDKDDNLSPADEKELNQRNICPADKPN